MGIHYNKGSELMAYLKDPSIYEYENGYIRLNPRPGLGIEIDEDYVKEAAENAEDWKNPWWRNHDGTVAEW